MSMQYLDSVTITNPAGTTIYSGACDLQDNADRFRTTSNGLLIDQGDGRGFLPVANVAKSLKPGFTGAAVFRDGRSENVAIAHVDRLDDSFSYNYDS